MLEGIDLSKLEVKKFGGAEIGPKYVPKHATDEMSSTKEDENPAPQKSVCSRASFTFHQARGALARSSLTTDQRRTRRLTRATATVPNSSSRSTFRKSRKSGYATAVSAVG